MKRNLRDIQRLMLIFTAAVVGFEFCLAILNYFVDKFSTGATGLDSLQTWAMVESIRFLVSDLGVFLLPFWQIGVIRAALCKTREQELGGSLTFGFTRFGPVLGYNLFMGLILSAVAITTVQLASTIYALTPMGREASLFLAKFMQEAEDPAAVLTQIPFPQLWKQMAPAFVLSALLGIPLVYLVWCRFRFAAYLVMEDEKVRAVPAMFVSALMAKKQVGAFLKLDLKFWWYYLLMGLTLAMGYGDVLLLKAGLKVNGTVLLFAVLAVRSAAQLAIAWFLQAKVELAYAAFYDQRKKAQEE